MYKRQLRKKLDSALIEFSTATLAMIARNYLDQVEISGQTLVISFARFDRVRLPSECGQPDDEYTQDYSLPEYDKLHRFSTKELMTSGLKRLTKPTDFIHVSNIPLHTSGNDVREAFQTAGCAVTDLVTMEMSKRKKQQERIMCYFEMSDVNNAIMAMALMSGKLREKDKDGKEGLGLRIAFSSSNLKDETTKAKEGTKMKIVPDDQK